MEQDARVVYADIIDLPHHQSATRRHMPLEERAAQFAPFAALTGFEDMVTEEGRLVDQRIEPGEEAMAGLNSALQSLAMACASGQQPLVTLTCFVPDARKEGGQYKMIRERVRQVDALKGQLILTRREGKAGDYARIEIRNLLEMHIE